MAILLRFQRWYAYEIACDARMLAMIDSVPLERRGEPDYLRAIKLADHLARGREKWLWFMQGNGPTDVPWWSDEETLDTLAPRFDALHDAWQSYLASLTDADLSRLFSFVEQNGEEFETPIEVQLVQLMHHASYHRGQIVQLVDRIGAETVDTDYADYIWEMVCAARTTED
jgi:uncharacterized damage-inducible protein DinB